MLLPIFHVSLSLLHVIKEVGYRPTFLLLCQPIALFFTGRIFKRTWAVWGAALLIIICNDYGIISQFKNWSFQNSHWQVRYVTTVIMFWVNSRCVSYCLDNIWGDVIEEEDVSEIWKFMQMISFCFYIPLCISGPLITYKDYQKGVRLYELELFYVVSDQQKVFF